MITIEEYMQEYNTMIIQCKKGIRKSKWKCIGKLALLLLLEIALIVSGWLVNELTTLQYTPIAIWCGAIALAPFAYKLSKETLDNHDRYTAIGKEICMLANIGLETLKKMQEEDEKENDTNITV